MIVIDASVVTNMLLYVDERGRKARSVLGRELRWTAPEHWKTEVFSAVRGLTLGGTVSEGRAMWALDQVPRLAVATVSLDGLLPRMWQLRSAISGYDAAYVALAEARGLTLVTGDGRLARAATAFCRVELVT
ncbi:type II toxin-antitoxin system VapC family toxin [Kibdelosporangium lantanae]|uniref:Ribonuclease VapC n=1 Tax=Kibdelosporangium lantanae TaxID=1497396 RepID=A0ABW3M4E8_9PSEU